MKLLELIASHVSVRAFQDKTVEQTTLENILRAAQGTSTSSHVQAYSVIRISNSQIRQALCDVSGDQAWVASAPEFLVFCADLNRLSTISQSHGQGPLEGYCEHSLASVVDVALFAQSVLLGAESVGLGGVFIGGLRNDTDRVIELLGLPDGVFPVFGMCLGYPATKNTVKPRLPLNEILHENQYDLVKQDDNVSAYDNLMQLYYGDRDAAVPRTWKATVSSALQNKKREHIKASLAKQGFFKF